MCRRVYNLLNRKDLNVGEAKVERADLEGSGIGEWQTQERIAWEYQLAKCYPLNGRI